MSEELDTYLTTDTIIEVTKAQFGIEKSDREMTDADIAQVMRHIGSFAPDTAWDDNKPIMGRIGLGIMLSLTLYQFPEFYARHELWQIH